MVVMMDWTRTLFPSTVIQYVGAMINDYRRHLRGEGGAVFIKELHNNHAHHVCNDCGSTIYIIIS